MKYEFPKGFLWGAATSAYQVEGNNRNDWTEWEKKNAERLAREAKKYQKWQREQFPEMLKPKNYISGRAADHYHRFEEDFDLVKQLGHNAHRFSIEWSRIEPEEGKFNREEIEYYRKVVLALKERGIKPLATLYHWTSPLWLKGWDRKETVEYFVRYAEKMIAELQEVDFWITLNEPVSFAFNSYFRGIWPPEKKGIFCYQRAVKNLIRAHNLVYRAVHDSFPQKKIGIAKNNAFYEGGMVAELLRYFNNKYFLNRISQDFIGLNYYFHNRIRWFQIRNKNKEVSDLGWEIYPRGIYHVLKELKKYNKPIYITENGLADARDEKRVRFIRNHLKWIHKAIQKGVKVKGYLYWSFLDNFEWDKGYWPKFGLIDIKREIRPSAYVYADICRNNGL